MCGEPAERARRAAALGGMQVEAIGDEALLECGRLADRAEVLIVCGDRIPKSCFKPEPSPAIVWIAPEGCHGPADAIVPPSVDDAEFAHCVRLIGARSVARQELEALDEQVQEAFSQHHWRGGGLWRSPGELAHLAITDPLTGVFNRRYLDEMLDVEFARAVRERRPFSVLVLDLDAFKPVNDAWGHRAGDFVLAEAALRIRHTTRGSDIVCRYGGDEFAILAPETDSDAAAVLAHRLRCAIGDRPFHYETSSFRVACSLGCATAPTDEAVTAKELLHWADLAMLDAKRRGRSLIRRWHETAANKHDR